ncbi:BclA C-terminal domain-containing protein [Bacillus cereus]|uniref:BclA C-terminal domain-containing protein n=1 Tax=Bacillus cereus TaxID=1396 RepID=UPI0015CF35F5|nr:exosporium leader peptide-containing protein [Bacillus cereus]
MSNENFSNNLNPEEFLLASALDYNFVGPILPPIPPFTLPTGPTELGLPGGLYAFNFGPTGTILGTNDPVEFNTLGTSFGTAITQLTPDTFFIAETEVYKITVILYTSLTSASNVFEIQINGSPIPGTSVSLALFGSTLIAKAIALITTPAIVEVISTGLGLSLAPGVNASIIIEKVV